MSSSDALPSARPGSTSLLVALNVVYALVLVVLAYLPHVPTVAGIRVPDSVSHSVAYGLQALFLLMLLARLLSPAMAGLAACVGAGVFGGITELIQFLQPTRAPQLGDLGADCVGAAVAVALGLLVVRCRRPRRSGP